MSRARVLQGQAYLRGHREATSRCVGGMVGSAIALLVNAGLTVDAACDLLKDNIEANRKTPELFTIVPRAVAAALHKKKRLQ